MNSGRLDLGFPTGSLGASTRSDSETESGTLSRLEPAVLLTVGYSDLFDYSPDLEQIHPYQWRVGASQDAEFLQVMLENCGEMA